MAEREIKIDKNGTRYYQDHETMELKFECQHCGTWFQTTRKFNQKYCCGSCRSMATKGNSKKSKTQTERIKVLEEQIKLLHSIVSKAFVLQMCNPELVNKLDKADKNDFYKKETFAIHDAIKELGNKIK